MQEHPHCESRFSMAGYTLVEVLAVFGIILVVLAISTPLFSAFSGRNAIKGAAAQVQATLGLARQYAIANNIPVYFIIAGPLSSGGSIQNYSPYPLHADKCLRAYAVYSRGKDARDSVNGRKDDEYLKSWEYLPDGVVFDIKEQKEFLTNEDKSANLFDDRPKQTPMLFPDSGVPLSQTREFHYIKFFPDGRASWLSVDTRKPVAIVLAEGSVNWNPSSMNRNDADQYFVLPSKRKSAVFVYHRGGRLEVEHEDEEI